MDAPYSIAVFRDGYQSPVPIKGHLNKSVLVYQSKMFGLPIAYFVNVKLKERT